MLFFFPLTPHAFGSVFSIRNSDQFSNFSLQTLLSGLVRVCLKSYPRSVGRSVYLFTQPPLGVFLCNKQRAMRVCIFDFSIFLPPPFPTIIWRLGEIFINTHAKNAPFSCLFCIARSRHKSAPYLLLVPSGPASVEAATSMRENLFSRAEAVVFTNKTRFIS